jgi:zinc transport system substrate-binding protein
MAVSIRIGFALFLEDSRPVALSIKLPEMHRSMNRNQQAKSRTACPSHRSALFWIGFSLSVLTLGCQPSKKQLPQKNVNSRPEVYVVNYPLEYMAKRIGGNEVEVIFPLPKDIDPAFWQATSRVIAGFQKADLILINGASYSKWLPTVSLPESKQVDTSEGFSDHFIEMEESFVHQHGPAGEHSHVGTAFTTWLDFEQARLQAFAIKEGFKKLVPSKGGLFEENYKQLANELNELDDGFKAAGKKLAGQPLVFSHPIYQYFSRRYGLNAKSVIWEPGVLPDEESIVELEELLADHAARYLIWEDEPLEQTREILAEKLEIQCVVVCPCFNVREGSVDWLETMKQNLKTFESLSHGE